LLASVKYPCIKGDGGGGWKFKVVHASCSRGGSLVLCAEGAILRAQHACDESLVACMFYVVL